MAAVRSGHIMILQQHVAGDVWYVHDGNSGGHVTREHPRSIAGYTIVDPSAGSTGFSSGSAGQAWPSYSNRRAMARSYMGSSAEITMLHQPMIGIADMEI